MPVNAQSLLAFVRKIAAMKTIKEALGEELSASDAELLTYLIYEARSILKDKQ